MSRYADESRREALDRALMALDPAAPRQSLRDRVPYGPKKLASMARKFLTLSPEFVPNPLPAWARPLPKEPVYPAWTRGTRQAPCLPFESGTNTLPGMEWARDTMNRQQREAA